MNKLYTAVGRLHINGTWGGKHFPIVVINKQEYILDLQEMVLWSILNWRILNEQEITTLYNAKEREVGHAGSRSIHDCLRRLVQRGLVSEGQGDTGAEALYDLLASLSIIPVSENFFLRLSSFLKLTLFNQIPISTAKQLLKHDRRSENEKKVMRLAKQALLSTAEIIKCIDSNHLLFNSEDEVVDVLYHNDMTTGSNLAVEVQRLPMSRPVLASIANLYLRKQIIFERVCP